MNAIGHRGARAGNGSFIRTLRNETRGIADSRPFHWLVRIGFVSRAVAYGVIGILTYALAAGAGTMGTTASQQGALALIARNWPGKLALAVIAAGLLGYALWKLTQGLLGHGPEGGGSAKPFDRFANIAGGVAYLVFFAVAVRALMGSGGTSSKPRHSAAGVLGWPGGPVLVGAGGLILLGVSAYQIYDAISGGFVKEAKTSRMKRAQRRAFMLLGRVGISARALVFGLVGYFLLRTAIDFNPAEAVGIDGALGRLHHQAFGPWLVGLVATGLVIFATFSLVEGRYRRL